MSVSRWWRERRGGARRGQTLVEFAMVLPILLLMLAGVMEFGRMFQVWLTLEHSARTAIRYAVTGRYNEAYCQAFSDLVANPDVQDALQDCVIQRPDEVVLLQSIYGDEAAGGPVALCQDLFYLPQDSPSGDKVVAQPPCLELDADHEIGWATEATWADVTAAMQDHARLLSIRDEAHRGATGISFDHLQSLPYDEDLADSADFKVTICSGRPRPMPEEPNPGSLFAFGLASDLTEPDRYCHWQEAKDWGGSWLSSPAQDAGGPNNLVYVVITFNHPLITPIKGVWPFVQLESKRQMVVESFRSARVLGLPPAIQPDTPTPSSTPTASATPTSTPTNTTTPTYTPTPSHTPTETHTPTVTPTPSQTPTPTMTPTPRPPNCDDVSASSIWLANEYIRSDVFNDGDWDMVMDHIVVEWAEMEWALPSWGTFPPPWQTPNAHLQYARSFRVRGVNDNPPVDYTWNFPADYDSPTALYLTETGPTQLDKDATRHEFLFRFFLPGGSDPIHPDMPSNMAWRSNRLHSHFLHSRQFTMELTYLLDTMVCVLPMIGQYGPVIQEVQPPPPAEPAFGDNYYLYPYYHEILSNSGFASSQPPGCIDSWFTIRAEVRDWDYGQSNDGRGISQVYFRVIKPDGGIAALPGGSWTRETRADYCGFGGDNCANPTSGRDVSNPCHTWGSRNECSGGDRFQPGLHWLIVITEDQDSNRLRTLWMSQFEICPDVPPGTATPTVSPTPSRTPTASRTPTPSRTPTATQTPSMTPTPSRTPTASLTPTVSVTPTASMTPTPSQTPTPSSTPTPTNSPTPIGGG